MSKTWAVVSKILPFSCVDGPGNRLVIFLQGCNFNCLNCHNPYTIGLCRHCGDCVTHCPNQALTLNLGKVHWRASDCQQCDTCITNCGHQSSPMTDRYCVEDILSQVRTYLPFLNGITVSGGEATLQLPFIQQLFAAIKQADDLNHLTCLIDSNGYLAEQGWQKVLATMDGAMIDLKAWNSDIHKRLTGRDNQRVKQSIAFLGKHNKLEEVRLLIIPEQTDLQHHAIDIAKFLLSISSNIKVRINAFHHHGVKGIAKTWPSATKPQIEGFAEQLCEQGIHNLTLPAVYLG